MLQEYQNRLALIDASVNLETALQQVAGLPADKTALINRELEEMKAGEKKKGPTDKSKDFRSFLKQQKQTTTATATIESSTSDGILPE